MKTILISEGSLRLRIPDPKLYPPTAQAPAFYNPAMTLSRDISVLLLSAIKPKARCAVDLLAATGVRGLRIKKECSVKDVYINDANPAAVRLIKQNATLNRLKVRISGLRAHEFLATRYKLEYPKFDYLDIDPFGSPVRFLDAGVKAIVEKGGVIGVTATDTANLCGTYPAACVRKYGARPLHNYLMNEVGLRILIKKIQEMAAMYDLALTPLFSHATRHYMRAYLRSERGANKTNQILKQIGFFEGAGPLWLGPLYDVELVEQMYLLALKSKYILTETKELLHTIKAEAKIPTLGFFDLSELKLRQVPKILTTIEKLHQKGYAAARTHFSPTGIKTDAPLNILHKIV